MRNISLGSKIWTKQFAILLFMLNRNSMAFIRVVRPQTVYGLCRTPIMITTRWGSMENFDDMPSSVGDAASSDGEALAREFYQQIRQREEDREEKEVNEGDLRFTTNLRATGKTVVPLDSPTTMPRKFIGQNMNKNPNEPSAGLFSGRGVSVYSVPRSTPRQRMMENEFKLVGRNETTLLIQIAVTLGLLTFALYIGMTGGITSNDWSSVPDNIDTSMEGIEGLLPVPTDTEISLWL